MRLIIATDIGSIHAARWVDQFRDTDWEVHVVQAVASRSSINPEFRFGTLHVPVECEVPKNVKAHWSLGKHRSTYEWMQQSGTRKPKIVQALHEEYLAQLIRKTKPDLVHSLGLNIGWTNMCLPVLRVLQKLPPAQRPPWLYSTWGTDLSFYASLSEENEEAVKTVLRNCDYLATEHRFDLELAKSMGFRGEFVGFITGFGGVSEEVLERTLTFKPASQRKVIMLKGRDAKDGDSVGRAATAIDAFRLCEDVLQGFHIVIGSAQSANHIHDKVALLNATTSLKVSFLPYVSYEDMMDVYRWSRVSISLTVNDGIPSSLLEAMSAGAFPIFSKLDSINEVIKDDENGFLVPAEDAEAVAAALRKALTTDSLVDRAASKNYDIIESQFSDKVIRQKVMAIYAQVAASRPIRQATYDDRDLEATSPAQFAISDNEVTLELVAKAAKVRDENALAVADKALELNDERLSRLAIKVLEINDRAVSMFAAGLLEGIGDIGWLRLIRARVGIYLILISKLADRLF